MNAVGIALSLAIGLSLGFFGGGGSILTVPLFVYVFGLDAKTAIASSLIVVGVASLVGMMRHWRSRNVELHTGLLFGSAGMCGAYLGGRAAQFVDGALLLLLFAAMMAFTALAMWRGRRSPVAAARLSRTRLTAQGLAVGLFTGLIGAGGGFLIVPALTLWAGLPMRAAVGTSLLVIAMNSAAGFAGYAAHIAIAPGLVGAISLCAVAGSIVGASLAQRISPARTRRAFAGFVLVMAAGILVREADVWSRSARDALPQSVPQLAFAAFVLVVGVVAGRATRGSGADLLLDAEFEEGAGI